MRSINWAQRNINGRQSIGAENRADETTGWLNGLNVRVAVRIYLKDEQNDENEEENSRDRSDEENVSDSLWTNMSQVEFMICMFCA